MGLALLHRLSVLCILGAKCPKDDSRRALHYFQTLGQQFLIAAVDLHPALKEALLEWKTQSHRNQPTDFVFPFRLYGGRKALDLATVLKRKIRPAFDKLGIAGVGRHTFLYTVGML